MASLPLPRNEGEEIPCVISRFFVHQDMWRADLPV